VAKSASALSPKRSRCASPIVCHTCLADQNRVRGAIALMANADAECIVSRFDGVATVTRTRFKDCQPMPPLTYRMEVVDLSRVDHISTR
jgi:hypothetical protein